MDFRLSEDQQMLKDTVRRIAESEFAMRAAEIDRKEEFPVENLRILSENGLLGIQSRKSTEERLPACSLLF